MIGTELEAAQTVVEYFQMTPDQIYFEGIETSQPRPRTVGGQAGTIVTFEGTHEGREPQLRGFIAVDRSRNRSYLFVVL